MKRFTLRRLGALLAGLTIAPVIACGPAAQAAWAAQAAPAAAPAITFQATTHLTTQGDTALTYTGYMNGESFQQDGLTSYNGWEYTAYWDSSGHVNVSRRPLPSGSWQNVVLTDYTTTSTDSHNVICIGIAHSDGTIHLAFDMHDSTLRYRKSISGLAANPSSHPWTASDFGATQSQLTGSTLTQLTYPAFINAPGGRLQLALRVGASGSGNEVLYEYDSPSWIYVGEFIDGVTRSQNAYLFGIEYDRNGRLDVTWCWRETPDASTNHDLMYAYSDDLGRTWYNSAGTKIGTSGSSFITSASPGVTVWAIGQDRGLMNQESQVVDSNGVVHVLASQLPASAASQSDFSTARNTAVLVHYYRDTSGVWHQIYSPFLERSARSDIGVDSSNDIYTVGGDSTTHKLHIATASAASGWTDWTLKSTSAAIYYSDALIDHPQLSASNRLTIFMPEFGGSTIDIQDWAVG